MTKGSKVGRRDNARELTRLMNRHLGRRERVARKRKRRTTSWHSDGSGTVTLKLGRKKSLETHFFEGVSRLKKKFLGCVVETER